MHSHEAIRVPGVTLHERLSSHGDADFTYRVSSAMRQSQGHVFGGHPEKTAASPGV